MPNWTYNRIKCKREIGDKLLTITDDNYSLDFNRLIPMPEDLKLTAGSIEDKAVACYYLSLDKSNKNLLRKYLESEEMSFPHNYWNKYKNDIKYFEDNPNKLKEEIDDFNNEVNDFGKNFNSINELGKKYIDNIKNYGYSQWYDWRIENWGTKWNVEDEVEVIYNKATDEYDISFYTAWCVPVGIVEKYGELCKNGELYWEYIDEDYDGTHILSKKDDEIIENVFYDNDYSIKEDYECE